MRPAPTLRPRAALLGAALGAAALAAATACKERGPQDLTALPAAARVKFFNFGVNAPAVNFYANDTKVTAVSSTDTVESTSGTAYGAAGLGGFYSSLAAGSYTFTGRIAAAVDKNLVVATLAATLADGKAYSVFLSGPYDPAARQVDGFVVEDVYPAQIDYGVAYVRLVNAIANAEPLTLYAKNTSTAAESPAGAAVAYKAAGAFTTVPGGTYDLSARTGAGTTVAALAGVSVAAGTVYTVSARGDVTVTSTTAATRPQLLSTANR